jgi:pimeloyl-ACP methyl ester carboxylesterase
MADRVIQTPDGRTLSVVEGGDPQGSPVVVHHGTPGSRLLYGPHLADAEQRGVRLIGYDRPGYGGSTVHPGRSVADAAADVEAICDGLGLGSICTWGISGGGPHALACAALLPDRVTAAASLAGVTPYEAEGLDWMAGMGEGNIEEFGAVLAGRAVLEPALESLAAELLAATPEELAETFASLLSPVDREALTSTFAPWLLQAMTTGVAVGVDGWVDDDLAFVAPWGFDPAAIRVPVLVLQGREDRFVPFAHGGWLAGRIPGAEARLTAEDGHLTLFERRVPEVHEWLLARGTA